MNVDQLTAKFAQAYTKRAEDPTFTSRQLAPMSSADATAGVRGAQNAQAYLNREAPSGGGLFSDAGIPFQVQSGPTGTMSGAPELLARPIETQQSYGGGAFLDPTNAGFYSPFLDVPFVGADQSGFGTGSTLLSGLGAYVGTKGLLNRALLDPRSYLPGLPGVPRAPMYMTPEAADAQLSRSLGVTTGAANEVEGVKNPLSAVAIQPVGGAGKPVSVSTPNPTALRTEMASQGMVGPGVNSNAASDDIPRVEITATRPGPVTTTARFNPQTPLLRPGSRIPTLRGAQAALAPRILGGLPTGARGSLRGRFPLYAGLAGIGIPQILNAYNAAYAAPDDPTGAPFSGFIPRVGYNPAILGEEPGLFYSSPTLYEDVVGRDVPIQ